MDRIKELYHILELIKKHDLPLSPILEYAIKERERQYSESANTIETDVPMEMSDVKQDKDLSDYAGDFASLSVAISKGKKLPHKAILLLGVMQLIEDGELEGNMIPLDKSVADAFVKSWDKYFDTKAPSVWTPFYHLKGESFWHFKARDSDETLDMLLGFGGTPSIGKMRPVIRCAYFDDELFGLMNNVSSREVLRRVLIENYLQ